MTFEQVSDSVPDLYIERVRHERRVRTVVVDRVERITPGMLRIHFSGDALVDFPSASFDDHVKIIVPVGQGTELRDYTPRRIDRQARTLTIDFAVHDAGPATRWALAARPGDKLDVAGPRGSTVVSRAVRRWLLIGDETALPAIGRRIEEATAGEVITSVAAVADPADEQHFDTRASLTALWVNRQARSVADPKPLLARVRQLDIAPQTFV